MGSDFKLLYDFIDSAEISRKYPSNTAGALRSSLRLFESEINPEEKSSLELFEKNLPQIYNNVFNKNKSKLSVGSLFTYKKRVKRALKDFKKYGNNAEEFARWSPAVRGNLSKKAKLAPIKVAIGENEEQENRVRLFEFPTQPGKIFTVFGPKDVNAEDLVTLKAYLDIYLKRLNPGNIKDDEKGGVAER